MWAETPNYNIDTTSQTPSKNKNTEVDYRWIWESSKESYNTTHTEYEWNEEVGTINFIQQVHTRPGIEDYPELNKTVWQFQYEIYKKLEKDWIKHVFNEWIDYDSTPFHNNILKKEIQKAEESWDKDKLYELFASPLWWAMFYASTHEWVTIHKVCTQAEKTQTNNTFSVNWTASMDNPDSAKIHDKREEYALREIMQFLAKNPGEKVALIYWADHNFTDNLERVPDEYKDNLPKLTTTQFPNLEKKADEAIEKVLAKQEAEEELKKL